MGTGTNQNNRPASLPEGTGAARLIVCERSARWALALRRQLAAAEVSVHETRNLAQCWDMLAEHPASFLVIELSLANADALLGRLVALRRHAAGAAVAVVADRSLQAWQWLLREAGAIHFVTSPREVAPLIGIACRHLAQAAQPPTNRDQQIWASLPWKQAAHLTEQDHPTGDQ